MTGSSKILLLALFALLAANAYGKEKKNEAVVAYDNRSIIINGTRQLLFSGSIHYPRSTPEVRLQINTVFIAFGIFIFILVTKKNRVLFLFVKISQSFNFFSQNYQLKAH